MTRPQRSKLLYVVAFTALLAIVAAIVVYSPFNKGLVLIAVAVVLCIPGRVQGFVFRDHFRGRRLLAAGQPDAALDHCERFLAQVRQQPWKKHFIWCTWGIYSWDIEAMTLNNMGAALMNLGQFDAAKLRYEEALRIDSQYPVPHFNLGVLAAAQGDETLAREHVHRAETLGFTRTPIDRVIHLGQTALAKFEGQGVSRS